MANENRRATSLDRFGRDPDEGVHVRHLGLPEKRKSPRRPYDPEVDGPLDELYTQGLYDGTGVIAEES